MKISGGPGSSSGAPDIAAANAPFDPAFESLVERVMDLVPEAPPQNPSTTWVERRIREFDMKSAFGNAE